MDSWKELEEKAEAKGVTVIIEKDKSTQEMIAEIGITIKVREVLKDKGLPDYTEEEKSKIVRDFFDNFSKYKNGNTDK